MATNTIKTRIQLKNDTEAHWDLATNFRPKEGEVIIYSTDDTHPFSRLKIGEKDSTNPQLTKLVGDLPFIDAGTVNGHTVNSNVPANAVFTDTTYEFDSNYNASTNKVATVATVTNAINALDVNAITGSTTKTITSISETNGKISATYSDIAFPVTSVAGKTGAVTLVKGDVGLGNVENTALSTWTGSNNITTIGTLSSGTVPWARLSNVPNYAGSSSAGGAANSVAKTLIIKINSPATETEGTNKYTFDGSAAKTLDIKAGSNISLTAGEGSVTIANTYSYSLPTAAAGTKGGIKVGSGLSMNGEILNHSNSITAKTSYGSTATTASANGGTIVVTDIKYDAQGHVTSSTDRTITLSQTTYSSEKGISLSSGKFGHSNVAITAQSTQAVYPVTIDAYGHITGYGNAVSTSISVAGTSVSLGGSITADTLRTNLGLSNAMHFRGIATVVITDGSTTDPAISGYTFGTNGASAVAGDVIIDKDSSFEYVWSGSKWERLGGDSSYKTVQTAVSDPTAANTTSTTFIDTISQNTNGVITATKKTLPTASTTVAGITKVGASDGAASYGHTHTLSLATDSGTSSISLAANTKYKLTAGGSTYVFTTPSDTNTWRGIQDNLTSSTNTTESLSAKQGYLLANGSARDNTKLPYSGFAHYSNTNGNNNGKYYKISINSTLGWMLNFTIKLYHAYRAYDLQISGYQYGSQYWYTPSAIILGANTTNTIKVLFGYDSVNHLWVAIPAQQYTGISIISMTNGFIQVEQTDLKNLFTIEMVEGEPTTKQTEITAYRPWYRNEIIPISNGGTGAGTAADARTNLGLGSMATETAANYLKLSGGTMTGDLIIGETSSDGTVISSGSFKIGAKNDNYGIMPSANNWNSIGASNLYWYRSYVMNYYGTTSHITNWDANCNIGTASTSSAAATKGYVNFYNVCAAADTQTKTTLAANDSTTSNITITLPRSAGTLALTTSDITGNAATATTATNLAAKPSFATSNSTQITLTAGGKTSDAYTVPYATKASQDGDGNTISSTYLKLSGGKLSGNLELNAASGNSPALIFTRDGGLTDWRIFVTGGKLSFQSTTDASTWIERAYFADNNGNFITTGSITATSFSGSGASLTSLNASNISSGTLSADRLATSGATAGSYGDSAAQTPGYGATFKVPYITVDAKGRVTAISEHTVKIPASDNTDTKNTAGSTNSTSKLFLIGATTQAANPTTNSYQYTYTNNGLLSALKVGLNASGTEKVHMEWNNTDQSIDFIFD